MVVFICNKCNLSLRKKQVSGHNCNSAFACIDCGKTFSKLDYVNHNTCISEAEKTQGKDFKPSSNSNKGETRQKNWYSLVCEALNNFNTSNEQTKIFISELKKRENIPQKESKFKNFVQTLPGKRDPKVINIIWAYLISYKTKKFGTHKELVEKDDNENAVSNINKRKHEESNGIIDDKVKKAKLELKETEENINKKSKKKQSENEVIECEISKKKKHKKKKDNGIVDTEVIYKSDNLEIKNETKTVNNDTEIKSKKLKKKDKSLDIVELETKRDKKKAKNKENNVPIEINSSIEIKKKEKHVTKVKKSDKIENDLPEKVSESVALMELDEAEQNVKKNKKKKKKSKKEKTSV